MSSTNINGSFKALTRASWDRAATAWNDQNPLIRAWLAPATEMMLNNAQLRLGDHVLDIAAGAGDQTVDAAIRVGDGGLVLATDISAQILQFAQIRAQACGLSNVHCKLADAEDLQLQGQLFDAAICRLGLMFCPNPAAALAQVRASLRPGGRFSVIVFGEPGANPCIRLSMATAMQHAGLPAADPFAPGSLCSLARPGQLEQLFRDAGFDKVRSQTVSAPIRLATTQDYVAFIRSAASPIQQIVDRLSVNAQHDVWRDMTDRLSVFQQPNGWEGPNELLLCCGTMA